MSEVPLPIKVVVVFGAPATGKTTLLRAVEQLNRRESAGGVHFVTIDEPTDSEEIRLMINQMYTETEETIARGESIAAALQTRIMQRRAEMYQEFYRQFVAKELQAAKESHRSAIVVVCDGHVLTDDKLYMQSKVDSGQVSHTQQAEYEAKKLALLGTMHVAFSKPEAFLELAFHDMSGTTHAQRLAARDSVAERGVPAHVFARLAAYSARTLSTLLAKNSAPVMAKLMCDNLTPDQVTAQFYHFVLTEVLYGILPETRAMSLDDMPAPSAASAAEVVC